MMRRPFDRKRDAFRRGPIRTACAIASLAVLLCGTTAFAGEDGSGDPRARADRWPQFKGDAARRGDNPHANLTFPLRRILAVRLPSPIYASPAVVGDFVYVQDARGHLVCVDARTNAVVWHAENGGINNASSPAVHDGRVYVGSTAGHLAIHDAATGKLVTKVPAQGGVLTAPAIANGAIYFSTLSGKLTKIAPDGAVVWRYSGGEASFVDFAVNGPRIVFVAGTTAARAHRLHDHGDRVERLERARPENGFFAPTGGPVFLDDEEFAVQSYDSESGWFHGLGKPIESGSNDSRVVASVRGDRLYRGSKCWQFDAEGKSFRELWRADPAALYDGGFHSSPALAKDVLVVGSELGVVRFFPLDGEIGVRPENRKAVWEYATERAGEPNGAVSSSPAVVDGRVFFGGEDGVLYGLGAGKEVEIARAPLPEASWKQAATEPLAGPEWVTTGGDMGFSCVAENSPIEPPLRILWRTRVWSTFKGNMVVGGGRVYGAGRMGPLVALDARNGEILWKTHHAGVESRVSPTYADGRLFVLRVAGGLKASPYFKGWFGGPNGQGLYCHDAATGKTLWHVPFETAYHFNSDGVPVHEGRIFVCRDGRDGRIEAVALDARTGEVVWTTPLDGLTATAERATSVLPRRFAGALADGLLCVSVSGTGSQAGATLALEPATGKIVWRNDDVFIESRARIAARKGTLVVFNPGGSNGFEARTGKTLWTAAGVTPKDSTIPQRTTFYMQALTDRFLESRGREGLLQISGCVLPVFVNGLWYSHEINGSHVMLARNEERATVWSRTFLSHACPSPAAAYDRLYYAPNSEGMIYCFENDDGRKNSGR